MLILSNAQCVAARVLAEPDDERREARARSDHAEMPPKQQEADHGSSDQTSQTRVRVKRDSPDNFDCGSIRSTGAVSA